MTLIAKPLRLFVAAALAVALNGISFEAVAAAGSVEFVRGAASLQRAGRPAQLLGQGASVEQGDTITTGANSYAILKLTDGTRMTVAASSKMVLQTYDYKPEAKPNENAGSMIIGLLKGGLRTLTGVIPKRDAESARVVTKTATVGIRGTDFDVRVCEGDCNVPAVAANARPARPAAPLTMLASARVIRIQGNLSAVAANGTRRILAQGAALYPGDIIESAPGGHAVVAFRDESVMTVQPASRVKIEDFVFDKANAGEGRFLINLLKGGMRSFTGLIGKANRNNVAYRTPTATVGIRGTVTGVCVGSDCTGEDGPTTVATEEGVSTVTLDPANCTASCNADVGPGQSATVDPRGGSMLLGPIPAFMNFTTPAPQQVPVDPNLFGTGILPPGDGVFVFVRDGDVLLQIGNQILNLGKNEAGVAGGGLTTRLADLPAQLNLLVGVSPNGNPINLTNSNLGEVNQSRCMFF